MRHDVRAILGSLALAICRLWTVWKSHVVSLCYYGTVITNRRLQCTGCTVLSHLFIIYLHRKPWIRTLIQYTPSSAHYCWCIQAFLNSNSVVAVAIEAVRRRSRWWDAPTWRSRKKLPQVISQQQALFNFSLWHIIGLSVRFNVLFQRGSSSWGCDGIIARGPKVQLITRERHLDHDRMHDHLTRMNTFELYCTYCTATPFMENFQQTNRNGNVRGTTSE